MFPILQPSRLRLLRVQLVTAILFSLSPFCFANEQITLDVNSVDWPPFFLEQKQSGQVGLARELLSLCVKQPTYDVRYMQLPIKRTHQYMQTGQLDLAIYSFKPEREDFVWYSAQPLFHSAIGVATKRDFIQPLMQETDLEPWRIGYLAGLGLTPTLAVLVAGKKSSGSAFEDYSMEGLFDQLIASPSRMDLVINSREALLWMSRRPNYENKVKVLDLALERKAYFLTVSKKSKKLADPSAFLKQFDQCLQSLRVSGEYQKLLESYQLTSK